MVRQEITVANIILTIVGLTVFKLIIIDSIRHSCKSLAYVFQMPTFGIT